MGRCTKQRSKQTYARKGKKRGRKPAAVEEITEVVQEEQVTDFAVENPPVEVVSTTTISAAKIVDLEEQANPTAESDVPSGFRLIDISILRDVFSILPFPECFVLLYSWQMSTK